MFTRLQLIEVIEKIQKERQDALTKCNFLESNDLPTQDDKDSIAQQTHIIETCDGHIKMFQELLDNE